MFAYVRRTNKTYKLASGCEHLAQLPAEDVFWSVSDPDVVDRMEDAGGTCMPQGEVYICQNVAPEAYQQTGKKPAARGPARGVSGPSQKPETRKPETGDLPPGSPCVGNDEARSSSDYDRIPIHRLELLDGAAFRADPEKFAKDYEALTNGTFFGSPAPNTPVEPVGPVVLRGVQRLRQDGKPSGFTPVGRGGIAVFGGKNRDVVRVVRQPGRTLQEIQDAFPGVRDFMGGGALLIEQSRTIGTGDLLTVQRFTNPSVTGDPPIGTNQGLHAAQMNSALHVLVGVLDQQAYLLVTKSKKTGSQIQRDLCEQGFSDVVLLDGGRAFVYYKNGEEQAGTYHDLAGLTGLGVNRREPKPSSPKN